MRVQSLSYALCVIFLFFICGVLCAIPGNIYSTPWYSSSSLTTSYLFVKQPSSPSSNSNKVTLKDCKWPHTQYHDSDCTTYLSTGGHSNTDNCCIGTHVETSGAQRGNWVPDSRYGHCSGDSDHCPGGGSAGCIASSSSLSSLADLSSLIDASSISLPQCPSSFTDPTTHKTYYATCRPLSDHCTGLGSGHCLGTVECYDSTGASHACPDQMKDSKGNIYVQGSFCFQVGSRSNAKWCPGCPTGSTNVNGLCVCSDPLKILSDGVCTCITGYTANANGDCICSNPSGCGGGAGPRGDPQIGGFQGQSFQFHGLADEVFNLISTPTLQINSHFVYLSSGKCDYNDTECWTHPGTYIDQLGFSFGSHRIKIVAGTHRVGLRMEIDGEHISYGNYKLPGNGTDVNIKYHHHGQVHVKTHEFAFNIKNSDMFFNMEASLLDHHLLRIGRPKHTITDSSLCKKEDSVDETAFQESDDKDKHNHGAVEAAIEAKYGDIQVPLHGLLGQTWRNVLVCGKHWVGTVTDYVASDLFASDYFFNFYHHD